MYDATRRTARVSFTNGRSFSSTEMEKAMRRKRRRERETVARRRRRRWWERTDYEDETKAARRLFEAWKRALDATIEVPDREPAINALSCRGRRVRARERERERGSREKIEEEGSRNDRQRYSEGAKTAVERAGFVCL